jgi:hypothetical protein
VRAPEQRSFVGRLAALSGRTGFLMLPRGFYEADIVITRRVISYSLFFLVGFTRDWTTRCLWLAQSCLGQASRSEFVVFLAAGVLGIFAVLDGV